MNSWINLRRLTASAIVPAIVVMLVIGLTVGGGVVTGDTGTQEIDDANNYALIQGDQCFTIEPLGNGTQTVESFYDYRTPGTEPSGYIYSSYGTTHLQEDDTSSLFLYEGSQGLSLVFLHDQYEGNSSGGAITMAIDGLPEEGEWPVEDDSYSEDLGPGPFVEFDHAETSSRMTWVWSDNRTDGAAFRGGLDDDFEISIDPAFNDEADFRVYDGEISEWQAISATDDGYERTSLEMDEPLVIRSGGCTSFGVTELNVDETATAGEPFDVEATVENDGALDVTDTVVVTVDGEPVHEQAVTLEPGETTTLTTTIEFDEAGTYTVGAGEHSTEVSVDEDDSLTGFGVVAVAAAALLALVIGRWRR